MAWIPTIQIGATSGPGEMQGEREGVEAFLKVFCLLPMSREGLGVTGSREIWKEAEKTMPPDAASNHSTDSACTWPSKLN